MGVNEYRRAMDYYDSLMARMKDEIELVVAAKYKELKSGYEPYGLTVDENSLKSIIRSCVIDWLQ